MRKRTALSSRGMVFFVSAPALVALLGVIVAAGQQPKKEDPAAPAVSESEKIVQEQVEAYNRHDVDAFLKTYSAEVKLYQFPDKELSSGLDAMRTTYGKLFEREPDLKAKITKRIVQGDYVIDHEEVNSGGRKLTAVAIYRVKDGKIATVWFVE